MSCIVSFFGTEPETPHRKGVESLCLAVFLRFKLTRLRACGTLHFVPKKQDVWRVDACLQRYAQHCGQVLVGRR